MNTKTFIIHDRFFFIMNRKLFNIKFIALSNHLRKITVLKCSKSRDNACKYSLNREPCTLYEEYIEL